MPSNFEITRVLIADYVSQDTTGKWLFAGVYADDIGYSGTPDFYNPVNIVMFLHPLQKNFNFFFCLKGPNEKTIVNFNGNADTHTTPRSRDKAVLVFYIPPMPFAGFGMYRLYAGDTQDNMEVVYEFEIAKLDHETT